MTGPDFPHDNSRQVTCEATFKKHCQFPKCDCDRVDPPLTREELEHAREYARKLNTELRTYDAHLREIADCLDGPDQECYPTAEVIGTVDLKRRPWLKEELEEPDCPDTCRCEVCRFWS